MNKFCKKIYLGVKMSTEELPLSDEKLICITLKTLE